MKGGVSIGFEVELSLQRDRKIKVMNFLPDNFAIPENTPATKPL
jgi:hypothetical protein